MSTTSGADQGSGPGAPLARTPLYELHVSLGAKMVAFAGYAMPVNYPAGILKEHLHTRSQAGLFDVSHMGQALLQGPDHAAVAQAFEALVPADILALKPGQQRYTQLTNAEGGIIDDLMVTRVAESEGTLYLVVNASRKDVDFAHISAHLPASVRLTPLPEWALVALQGPGARQAVAALCPQAADMPFMTSMRALVGGFECRISRSGYTGEDGYEISVLGAEIEALAKSLLASEGVMPVGLGARDSLRLEAGLCLYGHDIDETTSPIEAGLAWSIQKRRRAEGGFPGAARIQAELANGPKRKRVGIKPEGRAPAREGTQVNALLGDSIGTITSGGFGPSVDGPVAMGYVSAGYAAVGTPVNLMVRGKAMGASVVAMPFTPHRYASKS